MIRFLLALLPLVLSSFLMAEEATVRGSVNVVHRSRNESGSGDVVVSLTPIGPHDPVAPGQSARLLQRNKRFTPHVIAITPGTAVEFPNQDPFFHDVFSIYRGKPFDLGLYESGAVRSVLFTRPGVSYIFCNIHPEMSAVVVVLNTPYFAITGSDGKFSIGHVVPGHYKLEFWHELADNSELESRARNLQIVAGDNSRAAVELHSSDAINEHLNKYGEKYWSNKTKY